MAIRLMNWLGAQGLGNGDRLCEERYWVGDGHNLRRSDRDANLLFGQPGSYNNALHETATYAIDGRRSCSTDDRNLVFRSRMSGQ